MAKVSSFEYGYVYCSESSWIYGTGNALLWQWIPFRYALTDVVKCIAVGLSMALTPHELIQTTWEEFVTSAMHSLQFSFGTAPI